VILYYSLKQVDSNDEFKYPITVSEMVSTLTFIASVFYNLASDLLQIEISEDI